jgi:hypothetical protein
MAVSSVIRIEIDSNRVGRTYEVFRFSEFHVDIDLDTDADAFDFVLKNPGGIYTGLFSKFDNCRIKVNGKKVMDGNLDKVEYICRDDDDYILLSGRDLCWKFIDNDALPDTIENVKPKSYIENKCKEYGMLTILEVHDETGSNDIADLKDAAKYFANMAESLKGTESYIIINIANEWHNDAASTVWRDGYKEAIKIIRDAGLRHCIMVDAGGYGQGAATIHSHGLEVLDSDIENNLIFSIHMYGGAGNTNKVKSNIDGVINQNLALCIGEFGWYHSDGDVDEDLILSYCQEKKVSWLAWSWYGNSSPVEYLDLVKDPSANPTLASYDNITIKNWDGSQSWTGLSCDWGKKIIDTWKTEAVMPTLTKCNSTAIEDNKNNDKNIQYSAEEQSLQIINKEKNPFYIYDMQGACIYTSSEEEVKIKTSLWVNGAYIVVTRDENFRFIKY